MELLGYCNSDRPIVTYRKDTIRFISDSDKSKRKLVGKDDKERDEKVREEV